MWSSRHWPARLVIAVGALLMGAAVLLVPFLLGAQTMRATVPSAPGVRVRALYLHPGDTITVALEARNSAGVLVLPVGAGFEGATSYPCLQQAKRDTVGVVIRLRFLERPGCLPLGAGVLYLETRVGSRYLRDTVSIARPPEYPAGSDLAVCLATHPQALFYTARDTSIGLAVLGADQRIPYTWAGVPDIIRAPWQGAVLEMQWFAVACAAGWRAWDVTDTARWWVSDSTAATVAAGGRVRWRGGPFALGAALPVGAARRSAP